MQSANRKLQGYGKQLQKVGSGLTVGVTTPLVALGVAAVNTFSKLEGVSNAFDKLNDKSLLNDLRSATKGTVSDLELMTAAVKARNFKIPLDQLSTLLEFARRRAKSTGESVDFLVNSIVTGIGRKSPLILDNLGISAAALKDSLGGVSAAASSIADVTKAVGTIASQELSKMGKDAFTLKEGFSQIGASIKNILGDVGGILAGALKPIIENVKDLVSRFQELSPETKKFIVILGGVAAAVGPLLALAGTILPAIGTGFALLTGPIGLIIAGLTAIGVIIYKNWAPIKQTLVDIANYFIELYNESLVFRSGIEGLTAVFKTVFEIGKFVFETLKNIIGGFIDNVISGFKTFGKIIKAVFTGNLTDIPGIIKQAAKESTATFKGFTSELANDWKNLTEGIKTSSQEALNNVVTRRKITFLKSNVDATAVTDAVAEAAQVGANTPLNISPGSGRAQETALPSIESQGLSEVSVSPLGSIAEQLPFQRAIIDEELLGFQASLVDFQEQSGQIMESVAENFAVGFAQTLAAIAQGNAGFGAVGALLLNTLGDLAVQLGKAAIKIGITMQAVKLAFTNPAAAIAAGIGLVLVGQLLKSVASAFGGGGETAFANGGIVYGPTRALVGEYAGARNNPEVIAPLDKLKSLINPVNNSSADVFIPETIIRGEDIVTSFNRAEKRLNRIG